MRSSSGAATASPGRDAELDERRLVEGLLARETSAIAELLTRSHHPVYCMACRLARDVETRRDWAHDVLLGILEDLERGRFEYRGPGSFWAWFRKRAYFRLLDAYRRAKVREGRESPQGSAMELADVCSEPGVDPAEELRRTLTRAALETCLDRLENGDHRRALNLLLFEDLAYESIAERLDAPLNTVRAWIRRGRLQVRKCLVESLGLLEGELGR